MKIIFATMNEEKMKEVKEILGSFALEIFSLKELGVVVEIDENGSSFEENAQIKARAIGKIFPKDLILADDSGLEIDAFHKEPGIHSARYLGEKTS